MAKQRACVVCGETIPEKRAKRVACVTCKDECGEVHRQATTSRAARRKSKRAKKSPSVLLKVEESVANTFKQAAQAAGLSQTAWFRLIVEALLEDHQTARGWALQRRLADVEPVALGAASVHVRLPRPLLKRIKERAAQDGQKPTSWLRTPCYYASLFADEWHLTGTVERLQLEDKFLKARDRTTQARTVKEEAVELKVEESVANTFKQAVQDAGLSQTAWFRLIAETLLEDHPTARGWALQRRLADAEPVALGATSIQVRLPVALAAKVEMRAAQDGQKPTSWLRTPCYCASLFADEWYPTKTIERLKLGDAFLKAHDHAAQARMIKRRLSGYARTL